MLSPSTERRVVAFVQRIASRCTVCLRRCDENCRSCISLWANSILTDIEADRDGKQTLDYSLGARTARIIMQLTRTNAPMLSKDIDLGGLCSFQLKLWTLKKLCRRNIIGRRVAVSSNGRNTYYYFLKRPKKKETKNENNATRNLEF